MALGAMTSASLSAMNVAREATHKKIFLRIVEFVFIKMIDSYRIPKQFSLATVPSVIPMARMWTWTNSIIKNFAMLQQSAIRKRQRVAILHCKNAITLLVYAEPKRLNTIELRHG
jgi:hypothetical protein